MLHLEVKNRLFNVIVKTTEGAIDIKQFKSRKELMTYLQTVNPKDILSVAQERHYDVVVTEEGEVK